MKSLQTFLAENKLFVAIHRKTMAEYRPEVETIKEDARYTVYVYDRYQRVVDAVFEGNPKSITLSVDISNPEKVWEEAHSCIIRLLNSCVGSKITNSYGRRFVPADKVIVFDMEEQLSSQIPPKPECFTW